MADAPATGSAGVAYASRQGRWILAATVLGSGIAFLDATVVTIALPTIGRELDAGLGGLQWTVNAYTLTLAGFLLLGGALGDRYGRRRVFVLGVAWFAAASLVCAVAPNVEALVAARALQGVGAALLAPGSLALIEASFRPDDRGEAIGAWSGLGGVAGALGPFVGGWLIGSASWRLIFLINLPLAAAVIWMTLRHVPESLDPSRRARRLDVAGALLAAVTLAGATFALTDGPESGWGEPRVVAALAVCAGGLLAFVLVERRAEDPLVPGRLLRVREFASANLVTLLVYAALGGVFFLLPLQLQTVLGYTALEAGVALLPMTIVTLLLSARGGRLAARIGPRLPMTIGPLVAAAGIALMTRIGPGAAYVTEVLPAVTLLALGLAGTVAPLTTTVLGAAPDADAGLASAINNTVARVAGLLAVAVIPVAAGLMAADYLDPAALDEAFDRGVVLAAALAAAGGLLAFATIRSGPAHVAPDGAPTHHCAIDATPLRPTCAEAAGQAAA
jgi:EmrB/QacA subfamily drug resistance transporter